MQWLKPIVVAGMMIAGGPAVADSVNSAPIAVDIPSQNLSEALNQLAKQTGLQLIFNVEEVMPVEMTAPAVKGVLTPEAALKVLLANTGLRYKFIDSRTVALSAEEGKGAEVVSGAGKNDLWSRFLLANSDPASATAYSSNEEIDGTQSARNGRTHNEVLEEVVVTAQKREQNIQDVPIPVSVLQGDALIATNSVNLRDFFSSVPGISYNESGVLSAPVIRGVTTGGADNPATTTTIDGTPFGTSTSIGGGFTPIEIDPSDLSRIEVLRGPQGTLYGASSLGGLINYVTIEPSLTEFGGRVTAGAQTTENGVGVGHSLRASLNAPLSNTFAVRTSGFVRHEDGFIDDPVHNEEGVNDADSYGMRVAALWQPSDDFSLNLNAIYQDLELAGNQVDGKAPEGSLVNSTVFPNYFGSNSEITFLSATGRASLGDVDLTSISAYTRATIDSRMNFVLFAAFLGAPGADAAPYQVVNDIEKFSQELRLSGAWGERVNWLLGAFYTKEEVEHTEFITSGDQLSGAFIAPRGDIYETFFPSTYEETAAFANFSVHLSDRFDVELGARYSANEQSQSSVQDGSLNDLLAPSPCPCVYAPTGSEDESFTYSIAPQFHISSDLMIYTRIATGYRPGGPNYNALPGGPHPTVGPDTTTNYELGIKGDLIADLLSIDASIYRIDWDDVQVTAQDSCTGCLVYNVNGGTGQIDGVELALTLRPADGLTLAGWAAYIDARMTEVAPAVNIGASPGDPLPLSAEWTGNLSADYEFPVGNALTGNLGATVLYVGDRLTRFAGADGIPMDAYTQLDLRAGIEADRWQLNAFVRNATDKSATLFTFFDGSYSTITRPRVVGISFSTEF